MFSKEFVFQRNRFKVFEEHSVPLREILKVNWYSIRQGYKKNPLKTGVEESLII